MRLILVGALLILAVVTQAWAQKIGPANSRPPPVDWISKPTGDALARHYPKTAAARGIWGGVVLCCVPRLDGSVACKMAAESPTGFGFGLAAESVSRELRLTETSARAWRKRQESVEVFLRFVMADKKHIDNASLKTAFARFDKSTIGICRPKSYEGRSKPIALRPVTENHKFG